MQIKNIENNIVRLKKKNFLDTLNLKENMQNLCRRRKLYYSKVETSITENNIYLNANIFFPTEKIIKYKRNLLNRNPRFLKSHLKIRNITKIFSNRNVTLKTRILNKEVKPKFATYLLYKLKGFSRSFFSKKYTMFFDLIKITALTSFNKENIHMFTRFLGQMFKILPKRKHKYFIAFLKQLMNLLIVKNKTNIDGIKITLNGKIQGKTRSKTIKIQTGAVSLNSIKNKPIQSKVHIYTIYGTYGLQILANYNK